MLSPTNPFTISQPQNPWIGKLYVVQKRQKLQILAIDNQPLYVKHDRSFHTFELQKFRGL